MSVKVGEEASARFAAEAVNRMRREIADAGGREVFFAGSLNAQGLVERVRVCARGTDDAVLAFMDMLASREVVIHNHPSSDIAPSRADMNIAEACGRNGHGVYIVDNAVCAVYVVVEPFLDKDLHLLDPAAIGGYFKPDSRMARVLPHYEVRPQQAQMIEVVARAFNHSGIAVLEAPTGVGKTFAYLIPAVLWAVRNRERVVISTRTINLQEQIMFKDIPLLRKCLDIEFNAVLVKGRGNYVCKRKLARALSEATLFDDDATQATMTSLAEWASKTEDGSLSDLPFVPGRELWEQVSSEADTCPGLRCPAAKTCFVTKARRETAKADLIIANHHILFSDVSVKREAGDFAALAVLPAYHRVILDEAHSIEDSATEYFGIEASRTGALALLGRFMRREKNHEHGLIPYLRAKVAKQVRGLEGDEILNRIDNELLPSLVAARECLVAAFDAVREVTAEKSGQIGRDIKWRLTPEILADPFLREVHTTFMLPAVEEVLQLFRHCDALYQQLKRIAPSPEDVEPPFLVELQELFAYKMRLEHLAKVMGEGLSQEIFPGSVRWIEIDGHHKNIVRILRCPLDVGKAMNESVYGHLKTVVMTSATLSVKKAFTYFFKRTGLNLVSADRIETGILDSPFDFETQAKIMIPHDMPSPEEKKFLPQSVETLKTILNTTRGHALVLFTSYYTLDYTFKNLQDEMGKAGITLLKQGSATRTQLLEHFRKDLSSVLLATDSFWEGIDVAGEALQCVVVSKLPFRVPTEPIQEARAEDIDGKGGNSFMEYTVPQAVIKFRQGFGRLIRRKTDRGTIIVLDRRIATKYYGKTFLESLPGVPVVTGTLGNIYEALTAFYQGKDKDNHGP